MTRAPASVARAERRTGELLRETAVNGTRHQGQAKPGAKVSRGDDSLATLADLGITRNESSTWQKLAAAGDNLSTVLSGFHRPG